MSSRCLQKLPSAPFSSNLQIPLFLTPAFAQYPSPTPFASSSRCFTSTPVAQYHPKRTRETNKQRGVSAIRRTGPRVPLSVSKFELPKPTTSTRDRVLPPTTSEHGLWDFFDDTKAAMLVPEDESAHGRAWTKDELAIKSWEDLHQLYWMCTKERNRIATRAKERRHTKAGYGNYESANRMKTVNQTMTRIRKVLLDRHNLREDARLLVQQESLEKFFEDMQPEPTSEYMQDLPDYEPEHTPELKTQQPLTEVSQRQ